MSPGELGPSELGPWLIWLLFSLILAWWVAKRPKKEMKRIIIYLLVILLILVFCWLGLQVIKACKTVLDDAGEQY